MQTRLLIPAYFVCQAIGVVLWWSVLIMIPESLQFFQPRNWPKEALLSFWFADAVLLVGGSLITAIAVFRNLAWASNAIWLLAGAAWYPTLYCIAISATTGEAWIAAAMMVCMAGLSLAFATIQGIPGQVPAFIRPTPMKRLFALLWTILQVVIFWSVFLWILPMGIVECESHLQLLCFAVPGQLLTSVMVFVGASLLGLWSAWAMSFDGKGTPLPTAAAPNLVCKGPYRIIRNPMAAAGIIQGLAVGWLLGSFGVLAYSMLGAFAWHCLVRPVEERELLERFGETYLRYRSTTSLWFPSFKRRQKSEIFDR
jgi:protein-S-isoprenylcysteine O-methyltransferase Ste14